MNIQTAVVCDAATDDNGKLNLVGAFDTIYARELPAPLKSFYFNPARLLTTLMGAANG